MSCCKYCWARAMCGFVDRDGFWLHRAMPWTLCVYRYTYQFSRTVVLTLFWKFRPFQLPYIKIFGPCLIQVDCVFTGMNFHLSIMAWARHGDAWIPGFPVSSATWSILYSNWADVLVVVLGKFLFLHILGTWFSMQEIPQHGGMHYRYCHMKHAHFFEC